MKYLATIFRMTGAADGSIGLGASVLESLTTGVDNIAIGNNALKTMTTRSRNIAIGGDANSLRTGGNDNVVIGDEAAADMGPTQSIAIGTRAMYGLQSSGIWDSIFIGYKAGEDGGGYYCIGIGTEAGKKQQSDGSIAIGYRAGMNEQWGGYNVYIGQEAGKGETLGDGHSNTFVGYRSKAYGDDTSWSTALGSSSLETAATSYATSIGAESYKSATEPWYGVAVGAGAGYNVWEYGTPAATVVGWQQTLIGARTGPAISAQADFAVALGFGARAGVEAVGLGPRTLAKHTGSVAIGADTATDRPDQVTVGARDLLVGDATKGLVLTSPDGTQWRITVDNAGALSAASLTPHVDDPVPITGLQQLKFGAPTPFAPFDTTETIADRAALKAHPVIGDGIWDGNAMNPTWYYVQTEDAAQSYWNGSAWLARP